MASATPATSKTDPKKDAPKEYTKEEIAQLSDAELERFAKNLEWRGPSYSYGYASRQNLKKYKTKGHPTSYANKKITSRRQFLIIRLQLSRQETWNPAIKALVEERKKEEERKEALKPKVQVKTKVDVVVEIKDARAGGHTFTVKKDPDGKIMAWQNRVPYNQKKPKYGKNVCTAEAKFTPEDFEGAIRLAEAVKLPEVTKIGNAQVTANVVLKGNYTLYLERKGDRILISEASNETDQNKWHFNIKDLHEVIDAVKRQYKFEVVKKEQKTK